MQVFTFTFTRGLALVLVLSFVFGFTTANEDLKGDTVKGRARLLVRSPEDETPAPLTPPPTPVPRATAIPVTLPPGELYLPPNYNRLEIPRTRNLAGEVLPEYATPVTVHLNIRQILAINEADEEVSLEMDMHVEWTDGALLHATLTHIPTSGSSNTTTTGGRPPKFFLGDRFKKPTIKVLDPSFLRKIWKPDIFIENLLAVEQPDLMGKPAQLRWSSRGNIGYTARIKARIKCHFDFTFYPADTQACDVTLRSYSHNASALRLSWRRPTGLYLLAPDDDNFDLAVGQMRRMRVTVYGDPRLRTLGDSFDALRFTIFARRLLSFHILQTYVPSMLYIAITWLCFMVPKRMIEGRMAIVMTTLLTLTAMFGSVRESTPVVSYTKAIDRWMVACIAFVFLVLLEFSVLLWTESNRDEENRGDEPQNGAEPSQEPLVDQKKALKDPMPKVAVVGRAPLTSWVARLRKRLLHAATQAITFIEDYSFGLILLLLLIFNVSYWSWLLLRSGYHDWAVNSTHNAPTALSLMGTLDETGPSAASGEEELTELPVFA